MPVPIPGPNSVTGALPPATVVGSPLNPGASYPAVVPVIAVSSLSLAPLPYPPLGPNACCFWYARSAKYDSTIVSAKRTARAIAKANEVFSRLQTRRGGALVILAVVVVVVVEVEKEEEPKKAAGRLLVPFDTSGFQVTERQDWWAEPRSRILIAMNPPMSKRSKAVMRTKSFLWPKQVVRSVKRAKRAPTQDCIFLLVFFGYNFFGGGGGRWDIFGIGGGGEWKRVTYNDFNGI